MIAKEVPGQHCAAQLLLHILQFWPLKASQRPLDLKLCLASSVFPFHLGIQGGLNRAKLKYPPKSR
jgi:hypothetical protein